MPIDPMIANPSSIKLNDPMEQYNSFLKSSYLSSEIDKAKREQSDAENANNALAASLDEKGNLNWNALNTNAAKYKVATKIPAWQKEKAEIDKSQAEVGNTRAEMVKRRAETVKTTIENLKNDLDGIQINDPGAGFKQYAAHSLKYHQNPDITQWLASSNVDPQQAYQQDLSAALEAAKGGKEAWGQFLLTHKAGLAEASKQHYDSIDFEGHHHNLAMPEHSFGTPTASVVPGSVSYTPPDPRMHRPAQTTIVNIPQKVETEYGKEFAKLTSKQDADMLLAARKAPALAERADRILSTLAHGNVITGAGADIRLSLAKVLNLAGGSDAEKIANTERLVADLASNTLASIHASGLGTGNGFTDKDREYLEKAVAGKIGLNADSIAQITRLARHGAEQTAGMWNRRVKTIPQSSLQGTGIDANPIIVPAASTPGGVTPAAKALAAKHGW